MGRSLLLNAVFIFVLLPTAGVAGLFSLFALFLVAAEWQLGSVNHRLRALAFAGVLAAGWWGIASLSRLYLHFRLSTECPPRPIVALAGLVAGTAVSVSLAIANGPVSFISTLMCWPVLGALVLGAMLAKAWLRPNNSSKPTPLRGAA
jgi:hypothetical protein